MLRYWEMLYDCVRILWTMTLTASVIIVPVLAVRLLLKRAPKLFSYALWAAILFRLLCPVSIPAGFSALGLTGFPVYEAAPSSALTCIASGPASWPTLSEQAPAPRAIYPMDMIIALWLAGIVVMALYSAVSLLRLRRRLIGAVHLDKNIWLADHIQSPFVIGILRPKIYLPSNLPEQERAYILLHEEYHIRRLDHIVKLLFFLRAVHPLVQPAGVAGLHPGGQGHGDELRRGRHQGTGPRRPGGLLRSAYENLRSWYDELEALAEAAASNRG